MFTREIFFPLNVFVILYPSTANLLLRPNHMLRLEDHKLCLDHLYSCTAIMLSVCVHL